MSSILTNMSAMTAVQNLAATQKSLADVQNEISTGLKVSSAKDNAAYFSIATNMRTNIGNLSAVSDSLNLGSSVVATATSATTNLTSVLQSISKALVSASQPGTDLTSVQTQVAALRTQLANTVASASFNGVNLLDGSKSGSVSFVAGVTGTGANTTIQNYGIDVSNLNFSNANYSGGDASVINVAALKTTLTTDTATAVTNNSAYNTALSNFTAATSALTSALTGATSADLADSTSASFQAIFGNGASISSGAVSNIQAGSVAAKLLGTTGATITISTSAKTITSYNVGSAAGGAAGALYGASATNTSTLASATTTSAAGAKRVADAAVTSDSSAYSTANGALTSAQSAIANSSLFNISQISIDNSTSQATIQTYIQQVGAAISAVNAGSETLGAAASNISLQSTYTSSLSSSLTTGVGSLVDADMNEASTRLNALQTQQQLGVQALSVANQNSQLILKLFQ